MMGMKTTMTNAPKSAQWQLAVMATYGTKKKEMRYAMIIIPTRMMSALMNARLQLVEIIKCTMSHLGRSSATMARMATTLMNALIPAKTPHVGTNLSRLVKIVTMEIT